MARRKSDLAGDRGIAPASADGNHPGQLRAAVEALKVHVETLTNHVEVLSQVLDEIREDFQWALQNEELRSPGTEQWRPIVHITSLPKDPCAEDWAERVNYATAQGPPAPAPSPEESTAQRDLFE